MTDSDVSLDVLARRCFEQSAQAAERRLDKEIARSRPKAEEAKWIIGMALPLALIGACVAGVTGGIGGFLIVMGLAASV